jgi:hypothetical protein
MQLGACARNAWLPKIPGAIDCAPHRARLSLGKGGSYVADGNLSLESRGFDSLPVSWSRVIAVAYHIKELFLRLDAHDGNR